MVKIVNLLAKLGLVYADRPVEPEPPAGEPAAAATPPPATLAPPATGARHDPGAAAARVAPAPFDPALEAAAATGAVEDYPFEQIYASAGIQVPEHGFTVYKLMEMMDADELRGLDDATRARVLGGMLRRLPSGPISVDDIVRDAVRRDQALDAFERFLGERVDRVGLELEEKNRSLQGEIDELVRRNTEQMEANRAKLEAERQRLERWRGRKRAEEDRLFAAVQPFVEANPVTRGVTAGEGGPTPPASAT